MHKGNKSKKALVRAIAALTAMSAAGHLQAQALEEVIVTATKRTASVQDIPISISVVTQEQLASGAITDVRSLTDLVPGFTVTNAQSTASAVSLKIRGVGTVGNNAGFEGAVGVFVDGVYQPRPGMVLSEFVDIQSVEILKGPQGTLFGKNTTAGALAIKTVAPVIGVNEGFVEATAGNYELWNVKGAYNLDVSDTFAMRVAGSYRNRDGVYDGVAGTGLDEAGDRDRYLARLSGLWQPTDDISLRVTVDASENDEECCAAVAVTSGGDPAIEAVSGFPAGGPDPEEWEYGHPVGKDESDQQGITAELNWGFDNGMTFTYVGSYRDFSSKATSDGDFSVFVDSFTSIGFRDQTQDFDITTHEVRLQGLAFDDRLDWLVGAYYSDESIETGNGMRNGTYVDDNLALLVGGLSAVPPLVPLIEKWGLDSLPTVDGTNGFSDYEQDAETWAIFTHNIFDITDRLSFTLGLRYVDEDKDGGLKNSVGETVCPQLLGAFGGFAGDVAGTVFEPAATAGLGISSLACQPISTPAALTPLYDLYDTEFEDDELTWTTSLSYLITEDITSYATVSYGFKSGGINLDPGGNGSAPGNQTFDSEKITNYEVGVKSDLFDGRVRLNAALFYMDIEDYQLMTLIGLGFEVFNIPDSEAYGGEFELTAAVTDNLIVNWSTTYTKPEFDDDCAPASAPESVLFNCGKDYVDASEWSSVFGLDYTMSVGESMELSFRPSVIYEDEQRPSPPQARYGDSVTLVNASVVLASLEGNWTLELWGKNLTEEAQEGRTLPSTASLFSGAAGGDDGYNISFLTTEPRTYGLTARYNF